MFFLRIIRIITKIITFTRSKLNFQEKNRPFKKIQTQNEPKIAKRSLTGPRSVKTDPLGGTGSAATLVLCPEANGGWFRLPVLGHLPKWHTLF